MKYIIVLLFLFQAASGFAQNWTNINFGIKESEIRKVLEAENVKISDETDTFENTKYYTKIGIKEFIIGGHNFHVQFLMNRDDVLGKILYTLQDESGKPETYDEIIKFYTKNVGAPDSVIDENSGVVHKASIWKTPGSTISISYHYYSILNVDMVNISYIPPKEL